MDILIAIPVKPFGVAKARLADRLDAGARARLGRAVAARTVETAGATGAMVAVITADEAIARWAKKLGAGVIAEPPLPGSGLDRAARAGTAAARTNHVPWIVLHADLPLIGVADVVAAGRLIEAGRVVLAPSYDGGTNLIGGGPPDFPFAYGPGSFRRHIRAAARLPVAVLVRPGLAIDLDRPRDLDTILTHPAGAWLHGLAGDRS